MSFGKDRDWVYAARVGGTFQRLHRISGVALQAILFATPWLMIGGYPALLVDLPARRLYVLGAIFGPTDSVFLVLIGLMLAFGLFFFTALFGRLWCGYFCPQTVFLEEWVRRLEEWIEGPRGRRRARDRGPWTWDRAWRKAAKWTAFAALAAVVSMTLVSYFAGARELWTGQGGPVEYGLVAALGATLFFDFAWFREQFCNYLCPYARFQGALSDDESLVLSYDAPRGEPRKKGKRAAALADAGACIDCGKCVAVCPQGIDIREGFQLECINCARCLDACETVMPKLGHENLIRYTTVAREEGRESRWVRPRTVAYAVILLGLAGSFFGLLATRHELEVSVNRAPGSLYQVDEHGAVRNTYLLQVANRHPDAAARPEIRVEGLPGAEIVVGPVDLAPGESVTVPLIVSAPEAASLERTTPLQIHVETWFDAIEVDATFKSAAEQPLEG